MTMTESSAQERTGGREFTLRPDGSLVGDDGSSGQLAAALRYACRLADTVGEQLGLGDLVGLATTSSSRLTVRVGWDLARECTLRARLDVTVPHQPRHFDVVGGAGVKPALAHCMQRVHRVEGVRWSALVTADARVVAAQVAPGPAAGRGTSALPGVGTRVLAVVGAIPQRHLTGHVRLTFERGTLLLVPIRQSCLYVLADAEIEEEAFTEAVDEVRAVLEDERLGAAETVVDAAGEAEPEAAPVAQAAPVPPTQRRRWRRG